MWNVSNDQKIYGCSGNKATGFQYDYDQKIQNRQNCNKVKGTVWGRVMSVFNWSNKKKYLLYYKMFYTIIVDGANH